MATSIHALAFKATFDTKPLKDGMVLTRGEIRKAKMVTDEFTSSSRQLAKQEEQLNRLVSAGAIHYMDAAAAINKATRETEQMYAAMFDQIEGNERLAQQAREREEMQKASAAKERDREERAYRHRQTRLMIDRKRDQMERRAAESARITTLAMDRENDQIQRATELLLKHQTPMERLKRAQLELNVLYRSGKISLDAYNKEMAEQNALARSGRGGGMMAGMGGRIAGAAGGLIGVHAITSQVRSAAEQMDRLDHLSNKLSLPVEDLQRFAFAAQRFGEMDLEASANGLGQMNKAVFMLEQGNKKAVATFDALGLEAEQFAGLGMNDKFLKIAEALRQIDDEGKQLALTEKIFGSGDFVGLMKTSNEELDAMMNRLDELGGVASAANVAAVAAAADKWGEVSIQWASMFRDLAVATAPIADAASFVLNQNRDIKQKTGGAYSALNFLGNPAGMAGLVGMQAGASAASENPNVAVKFDQLTSAMAAMVEGQRIANEIAKQQADHAEAERSKR